ncbi:MAG: hypothetical protein IPL65_11930 [Lewinellaceae bacterium]|nr:hypothetical protein [Lewinellaceae bacterium]
MKTLFFTLSSLSGMNTSALIMMLVANGVVIGISVYYFVRILRMGPTDHVDEDEANYPRGG